MFSKIDRHAMFVYRMAEKSGADLADALVEGKLTGHELRNAIFRCTGCRDVEACKELLASEQGETTAPPEFCLNRDLMERLRG